MDRRFFLTTAMATSVHGYLHTRSGADEPLPEDDSTGHFNLALPTQGGKQFWADEFYFHDMHIQRNVLSHHCRLLDGGNVRRAWGTFEQCHAKLRQIADEKSLPAMQGDAVVLLHGLFRSSSSMNDMARFLKDQGGYSVFNVSYPSTRASISDHAQSLHRVLQSLEGIDNINIVAHSLGNIVLRQYLTDQTRPEEQVQPDSRLRSMVMLGPPNQGSQLARTFSRTYLFRSLAGKSAVQLGKDLTAQDAKLATPSFPFGIIAGGHGDRGYNPWLTSDDDLIVTVESTRLAGASDFAVVPVMHTYIMDDPTVQQYTLQFFSHGYFISPEQRNPIAAAQ